MKDGPVESCDVPKGKMWESGSSFERNSRK